MKIQRQDDRTKEDLITQIAQKAKNYVPEWTFDPAHPDAGTALALIFAELFSGTVKRYDRIPEKLRRRFYAEQNIRLLPARPAEGYALFSLSSQEFGGTRIPKGTVLTGPHGSGEDEDTVYETTETFFVTPARLTHLIYVDGRQDYVEKKTIGQPFFPFSAEAAADREHVLYLCQSEVLHVGEAAEIRLTLEPGGFCPGKRDNAWMKDHAALRISYATRDGFREFPEHRLEGETIVLSLPAGQPLPEETELFGKTGYWLCCRCPGPWNQEPFYVQDIRLLAWRSGIRPDLITNGTGEQPDTGFLPFGESPALFSECYFASAEALGKPGADVRLTFLLDYEKIPLDNSPAVERKWKILMRRADFAPDPEYDITVEQVVWEYFNGNGWSRLPVSENSQRLFNGVTGRAGDEITLSFRCPDNAAPLAWESAPTRILRVRVLRMNNLFRPKGTYITPKIHNVHFHYSYPGKGKRPDFAMACNHGTLSQAPAGFLQGCPRGASHSIWEVFSGRSETEQTLYLGFDQPLATGPVNLFCDIAGQTLRTQKKRGNLTFSYGRRNGFAPLFVIDGTDGLQKSGCLTFPGKEDFAPQSVCGEEAFWIRITREGSPAGSENDPSPLLQGLWLNAGNVLAAERRPPEYFEIKAGEKNKVCRLQRENIYDLTVQVNEGATLQDPERETLKAEGRLRENQDADGDPDELWVEWEETADFSRSGASDRHYLLDRNRGIVTFPDGVSGALPAAARDTTVCIEYRCVNGSGGNLPARTSLTPGSSLGYVSSVTALFPLCGGCGRETASTAMRRCSETLRHTGRAVTASDYELLAREASRSIHSVKCLPGYTPTGTYERGCVTLIVLPKDLNIDSVCFERLREQILEDLSCRMDGSLADAGRLLIAPPQYLRINCSARVVSRTDDLFQTQKNVMQCLDRFLHPVTGNYHGRGWEIGVIPNEAQIRNALKSVTDILCLRELRLAVSLDTGEGRVEIDPFSRDRKNIPPEYRAKAAVALSGTHTITAEPE